MTRRAGPAVQGAPSTAPLAVSETPSAWTPSHEQLALSEASYRWTARLFSLLERVLGVNLALHGASRIGEGEIFVFNHFARFETFIPQYFIYRESGACSRSIASSEFFAPDDAFSNYLLGVGAVPNSLPDLLPFLAAEVLRGRKVVVFPEGGMVKDRRVVDEKGGYSVYSRTAGARRKQHSGAALLGLGLEAFKQAVLRAQRRGDQARLEQLARSVSMDPGRLLAASRRPTAIVPSNITFYPIRVGENLLSKGAELINSGLSRRLSEELMIEGNILLEDTDMDTRLGEPVRVREYWRWWERPVLARAVRHIGGIQDAFSMTPARGAPSARVLALCMRRETARIRDEYMHRMYTTVTVHLSHLACVLILTLVEHGQSRVTRRRLDLLVYLAVKRAQALGQVHLHRSLRNPDAYQDLPEGSCAGLDQLLETAARTGLLERDEDACRFLPKLREEHHFDAIRLENLVEVYANEVKPLHRLQRAIGRVVAGQARHDPRSLSLHRVDDENIAFRFDKRRFARPRHRRINEQETAVEPGGPYLLEGGADRVGVVLVHGFLASPAELRGLAGRLNELGHTVYGVRLKGHGTSPHDLGERSYEDWAGSVSRGIAIMRGLCERVAVVGFSTGGSLALHAASGADARLAGVCAINVPVRFRNPRMRYVPMVHRANRLVRSVSTFQGVKAFTVNESENPDINYRHIPVRGLYELHRLVEVMLERAGHIRCPVSLLQGTQDPVVVPEGVDELGARITGAPLQIFRIEARRHGIAHRNVGETWSRIEAFVAGL